MILKKDFEEAVITVGEVASSYNDYLMYIFYERKHLSKTFYIYVDRDNPEYVKENFIECNPLPMKIFNKRDEYILDSFLKEEIPYIFS